MPDPVQEKPDDAFAAEPPAWARDPFNGDAADKCGVCGAWCEVVRPGKTQCSRCDGREEPAQKLPRYRIRHDAKVEAFSGGPWVRYSDVEALVKPVAWLVHDFHVARQPVKARGKFPEPDHYLYPAAREKDARDVARIMGGECAPLYPASALEALQARVSELGSAIDAAEIGAGISSDGTLWRWWSQKSIELAAKNEALQAEIERLKGERDEALAANELYAITEAQIDEPRRGEAEALDGGTIRICPMRDGPCPHGMSCPYVGDGPMGYPCKEGWRVARALTNKENARG